MQSEFIKLTDPDDGDAIYIRPEKITGLITISGEKTIITYGESLLCKYAVKETPEQIFKLIDAAKNIVKH